MDIMRPPHEQQVAPALCLVARSAVNVPALIKKALTIHPHATVDGIAGQVQVSGIIISMWMMKWKVQTEQSWIEASPGKAAGNAENADSYCTCSEESCTCGTSAPRWWHQYCCGARVTSQQIKERDKFFEHATT